MPGLTMKDQVQDLRKEEATVIFEFWICLVKAVPAKAVCLYCSLTFISLASISLQCLVLFIKLQLPVWHRFTVQTSMPKNKGKIKQWIPTPLLWEQDLMAYKSLHVIWRERKNAFNTWIQSVSLKGRTRSVTANLYGAINVF